jgi:hypothetical protein
MTPAPPPAVILGVTAPIVCPTGAIADRVAAMSGAELIPAAVLARIACPACPRFRSGEQSPLGTNESLSLQYS